MAWQAYAAMAGLQLAGGYFASQNLKETAKLNQEIAEMNAEFAELDAYDARIEGVTNEAKYQKVIDATLSEQQARLTASGVDVNYGSAGQIQKETRFIAELNKMEIQKQAQEAAMGYSREARQTRMGGTIGYNRAQAEAESLMFQSLMGAGKTGIQGASSYYGSKSSVTGYK